MSEGAKVGVLKGTREEAGKGRGAVCGIDDEPNHDENPEEPDEIGKEDEYGSVRPITAPTPHTPSRHEIMEHNITHWPYRSWCPHCVRGKAKSVQHGIHKQGTSESTVPVLAMDYAFMKERIVNEANESDDKADEVGEAKFLVMKDSKSKYTFGIPVPTKGVDDQHWAVKRLLQAIDFLGYPHIVLKCDQESALKAVIESAKTYKGEAVEIDGEVADLSHVLENKQIVLERSPVGDSRANGMVERTIQSVEGQIRTLRDALEDRIKLKLNADDCVIPWLIQNAGEIISNFSVGPDGKVPFQRVRGRKMRRELVEFGEMVHWMPADQLHRGKFEARWHNGIWLGVRPQTSEVLIGTPQGVFKARSVKRMSESMRWNGEAVKAVKGTPWKPYLFSDSDKLRIRLPEATREKTEGEQVPKPKEDDPAPKRFRIERRDLDKYGYTPHCPGCFSVKNNRPQRSHNEECRKRIARLMLSDEANARRLEAARLRENSWLDRQAEKQGEADRIEREPTQQLASPPTENPQTSSPAELGERIDYNDPIDTTEFYREVDEAFESMAEEIRDTETEDTEMINQVSETREEMEDTAHELRKAIAYMSNGCSFPDIAEIYSPPRVTALAHRFKLNPGFALDLTVSDPEDGLDWNFDVKSIREKALRKLKVEQPMLLIGSPMCKAFSVLQGLNRKRMGEEKFHRMLEHARIHLRFCMELYAEQARCGRYYLHEHPKSASSWREPEVQKTIDEFNGVVYTGHMCQFGMKSRDEHGERLVLKPTGFMANSEEIGKELSKKCDRSHRHVQLISGRAHAAEIYPPGLCLAILRGLKTQMIKDGTLRPNEPSITVCEEMDHANTVAAIEEFEFYDDISGLKLDTKMVLEARAEEMRVFKQHGVYEKVDEEECWRITGKAPVGVKWIDVNKGDAGEPEYRSRLVAKERGTTEKTSSLPRPPRGQESTLQSSHDSGLWEKSEAEERTS